MDASRPIGAKPKSRFYSACRQNICAICVPVKGIYQTPRTSALSQIRTSGSPSTDRCTPELAEACFPLAAQQRCRSWTGLSCALRPVCLPTINSSGVWRRVLEKRHDQTPMRRYASMISQACGRPRVSRSARTAPPSRKRSISRSSAWSKLPCLKADRTYVGDRQCLVGVRAMGAVR